ncbi:hypothetical protein [Bacillus sp. 1P06AnD]|uniref:hypothetical protein n=1 Tax=Bacillus sp. 1P06AnD TaxID=3132208 RepID=UPI0039A15F42
MGLITAKIAGMAIASVVTVGAASAGFVAFNGHNTMMEAKKDISKYANAAIGLSFTQDTLVDYIDQFKKKVKASIANANSIISNKNVSIGSLQGQVKDLQAQVKSLNDELATIKKAYDELQKEHKITKDELAAKIKELDETKTLLASTQANLEAALAANADLKKQNDDLADLNTKLVGEVNKANADAADLQKEIDTQKRRTDQGISDNLKQGDIDAIGWDVDAVVDNGPAPAKTTPKQSEQKPAASTPSDQSVQQSEDAAPPTSEESSK